MPGDGGVFLQSAEGQRDAVVLLVKNFDKTPHRGQKNCGGINIVTTRCRLLCRDDSGAEFFGDDLASYQNSSISCSR